MTPHAAMFDPEQIREGIKRARETLDAIDPDRADDELTRRRIEFARQHCEDLVQDLEALLRRKGAN